MGLFDRRKRSSSPAVDAFTTESVGRMRALPQVATADVVDGDTLTVSWSDGTTGEVSLAELRPRWAGTRGFERIELMDAFFAQVGPSTGPSAGASAAGTEVNEPWSAAAAPVSDPAGVDADGIDSVRPLFRVGVRRSGADGADVSWTIEEGIVGIVLVDGRPVTRTQMAAWGCDARDVQLGAIENLTAQPPGIESLGTDGTAWIATRPGGEAAVWLAAPAALLGALDLTQALVLAPLTSELVIVDLGAADTITSVLTSTLAILEEAASSPEALPPRPLVATPEGLRQWSPPAGHPAGALAEALQQ